MPTRRISVRLLNSRLRWWRLLLENFGKIPIPIFTQTGIRVYKRIVWPWRGHRTALGNVIISCGRFSAIKPHRKIPFKWISKCLLAGFKDSRCILTGATHPKAKRALTLRNAVLYPAFVSVQANAWKWAWKLVRCAWFEETSLKSLPVRRPSLAIHSSVIGTGKKFNTVKQHAFKIWHRRKILFYEALSANKQFSERMNSLPVEHL